jgi:hypothetical protein
MSHSLLRITVVVHNLLVQLLKLSGSYIINSSISICCSRNWFLSNIWCIDVVVICIINNTCAIRICWISTTLRGYLEILSQYSNLISIIWYRALVIRTLKNIYAVLLNYLNLLLRIRVVYEGESLLLARKILIVSLVL